MHHHGEALRRVGGDPDLVVSFARGDADAALDVRARRLLEFSLKLTREPHAVGNADVEVLRQIGLGDPGIHDAVALTAYFNFVNRMAQGLGVDLETDASG